MNSESHCRSPEVLRLTRPGTLESSVEEENRGEVGTKSVQPERRQESGGQCGHESWKC